MKRCLILLLLLSSLASGILAEESTQPASAPVVTPSTGLELLPPETPLTITAALVSIKTTTGQYLGSYDKTFDEGVKAGVAEMAGEVKGLTMRNQDLETSLSASISREAAAVLDAARARGWTVGIAVGGCVLISAAFIAGVWVGISLGR